MKIDLEHNCPFNSDNTPFSDVVLSSRARLARNLEGFPFVNRSTTSVLCPTENGNRCVRNWKLPLMLFSDSNKNKKRDTNEPIISLFEAFSEADTLLDYPKTQIRFNEHGMANYYNGTMSYCLNQTVKGIIISRVGRIRFARDLDGDHIPDVNPSTPVSCQ